MSSQKDKLMESPDHVKTEQEKILDAKTRLDYRVKFCILRETYKDPQIPRPTEEQSVKEIEVMYKACIKKIHFDLAVKQIKVYLRILWLINGVFESKTGNTTQIP